MMVVPEDLELAFIWGASQLLSPFPKDPLTSDS